MYIDGTSSLDQFLPETSTVAEAGRRSVYANASQDVDGEHLERVVEQQADGRRALAGLEDQLEIATTDLAHAWSALSTALRTFLAVQSIIADPTHGGRVFPVDGAFNFSDSWNAYRAHGGDKTNAHHATDIMARRGTPVVAIESGKIDKIGWNRLGGWRLWIAGCVGHPLLLRTPARIRARAAKWFKGCRRAIHRAGRQYRQRTRRADPPALRGPPPG